MTATTPSPASGGAADDPSDAGRMPLTEHIRELRSRLVRALIAIGAASVLGFIAYEELIDFLIEPACDVDIDGIRAGRCGALAVSGVVGPLSLQLKVALYVGLVCALPFWLWQLWAFCAPGLHRQEKRWAYVLVGVGAPLFAAGAALAYLILPVAVPLLLGFNPGDVANFVTLNDYIDFVLRMILVFGLAFQLPLVLVLANMAALVTSRQIRSWWRGMIFGIAVFAAVATPTPDPYYMLALGMPMTLLYGVAIGITAVLDRRRSRREPQEAL